MPKKRIYSKMRTIALRFDRGIEFQGKIEQNVHERIGCVRQMGLFLMELPESMISLIIVV